MLLVVVVLLVSVLGVRNNTWSRVLSSALYSALSSFISSPRTSSLQLEVHHNSRLPILSLPECGQEQHGCGDSLLTVHHYEAVPVLGGLQDDVARVVNTQVVSLASHHILVVGECYDDSQLSASSPQTSARAWSGSSSISAVSGGSSVSSLIGRVA